MGLNNISPGLRPIHYDAVSAAKVALVVQPDEELIVSDDIADQLLKSSGQFKDKPRPAAEPVKKAVKKASAKKPAADKKT